MKKKKIVCGILASSIALAAAFGGCSLVSTNNAADMNQVVAEVDISDSVSSQLDGYKSAVGSTSVIKRELITYYINYGYMYVTNYGMSTEQAFNMLLESLIENAVVVQYSTMYLLKDKATNPDSILGYEAEAVAKYTAIEDEAKRYEYLLGDKDVKIAEYNLCSSINALIDNEEKKRLDEEDSSSGEDKRDTPDGVDTEIEDYYPKKDDGSLDYAIYTGYEDYTLEASGAYKKDALKGTTRATRIEAFNKYISNLSRSSYDLVDKKTEDLRKVRELKYVQLEYVNQLKQRIIERYYDIYEAEQEYLLKQLDKDDNAKYSLLQAHYDSLLNSQTNSYTDEESFSTAMDSMSDTSFILYAPEADDKQSNGKFGFVYNILLPFDDKQSDALKELQAIYKNEDLDGGYEPEYFIARNALLKNIKTTDQRAAWFNGETQYAFDATDSVANYYKTTDNSDWLFFENNVSRSDRYEPLEKYAGLYPYNGFVVEKKDDFLLIPNTLDIDQMLTEFENYVKFVSGETVTTTKNNGYYDVTDIYKDTDKKAIDYSKFVYATGKVGFNSSATYDSAAEAANRANLFVKDSAQYKALSAVNELQYAYTTDTGVLSQYIGYTVQAGDTSYIKEFEYAAHEAVNSGAGSYAVCAGDYGWHLIYVTYTFDGSAAGGKQYTPDWAANIGEKGTFENLFYEWFKDGKLSDLSTKRRSKIITSLKTDDTVIKYQSRYQNLLDLDKQ